MSVIGPLSELQEMTAFFASAGKGGSQLLPGKKFSHAAAMP
ncbi:hypothetical protein [Mycobacterium sp.]